jgi:drug/metabolite transporter (DMT)-like permease
MTTQHTPSAAAPVLALLTGALLWGLAWWPLKHFGSAGISGNLMVSVSYGLVAILGLPVLWRQRRQWQKQAGLFLLIAVLGGWANTALVNALMSGNVVRVMLLFYMAPVWGVLAGRLFLGEYISLHRGAALALALVGAFVLLGGQAAFITPLSPIDMMALSAGLAFALTNVTTRAAHAIPLASKTLIIFLGCTVTAATAALTIGQTLPALPASVWGLIGLFSLTWLALATLATQYGVTHMQAGRASVLLILELVAAVISAMLIGGETLRPQEWIGGALIACAALLEARTPQLLPAR